MAKIAAIQMVSGSNVEENLEMASELISESAINGAQVVVLPEVFAHMGTGSEDRSRVKEAFGNGLIQDFLKYQALMHKVWIIGGTIPIACDNSDKIKAACLVHNDKGEMVARYDKMHLFDVVLSETESYCESNFTEPGDKIVTVDTPCGKIGLAVCYDIRFPELFRSLVNSGAEIFVLPAAFAVKTGQAHWETLIRARAIENFCYVVAATQGGAHANGRQTYGHAMIIEPWGSIVTEKTTPGVGIVYADIDLEHLKSVRQSIPALQHQKLLFNR